MKLQKVVSDADFLDELLRMKNRECMATLVPLIYIRSEKTIDFFG